MSHSSRGKFYFFVPSEDHGEVFFPPQAPFLRGYLVPSRAVQRVIIHRMDYLDSVNLLLLCAAILGGWFFEQLGFGLSLWLVMCELLYSLGLRRLVRRMEPLPLRLSLRLFAQQFDTGEMFCATFLSGVFGISFIAWGLVKDDLGLLTFGCGLMIWSGRLLPIFFRRLIPWSNRSC